MLKQLMMITGFLIFTVLLILVLIRVYNAKLTNFSIFQILPGIFDALFTVKFHNPYSILHIG